MTPYWSDDWLTVYGGDARAVLRELEPESVHCVVTSPPYWGLRDYGTASWDGGELEHEHAGSELRTMPAGSAKQATNAGSLDVRSGDCDCGARRVDGQLGLEPSPELYVAAMVDVFRELRRVLRPDGTVWLNLGDSYGGNGGRSQQNGLSAAADRADPRPAPRALNRDELGQLPRPPTVRLDLRAKDLAGIPWRTAFALQADGWYLRSDIVWSKPNPMPESVTDRPTKAHEYVFLLARSERYFYDAEAVREDAYRADTSPQSAGRGKRDLDGGGAYELAGRIREDFDGKRNLRSVWTIATSPYPGAHFATFPARLVEPCVKAGTSSRGVCPDCGAPWIRELERIADGKNGPRKPTDEPNGNPQHHGGAWWSPVVYRNNGWAPSCRHEAEPVPATVLDPFAGTGTVGLVAQSLSRRAVLVDLNPAYLAQCLGRNRQVPLGLT